MMLSANRNGMSVLILLAVPLLILITWWSYPKVHFRTPAYEGLPNLNTGQNPPTVGYTDNKDVNLGAAPVNTDSKGLGEFKEEDKPNKVPDPVAPIKTKDSSPTTTKEPSPFDLDPNASNDKAPVKPDSLDYWHILKSVSTHNQSYFFVDFLGRPGINPNIIPFPNPNITDRYVIVAQQHKRHGDNPYWTTELVCEAIFRSGSLQCEEHPIILPIAATRGGKCKGDLAFLDYYNIGPHDARVLYGPERPFVVFGSNSRFACFGQFIQDFRMLLQWPEVPAQEEAFRYATELQRPEPYGIMEKNWFPFWDFDGQMYVHHDVAPHRVYAKLEEDGSVGADLAVSTKMEDDKCIAKHFPTVHPPSEGGYHKESIHQATNSLSITLCKRADTACRNTTDNTFVMHIFQHKAYHYFHSVYEPYVMLFSQSAPFGMHAVSSKPLWINGRKKRGENDDIAKDQTEMMYITSMNWQKYGRNYHGYLDDVLMLGFGIEDRNTGGIDVLAGDLLGEMALCGGGTWKED